jgi:hypothetical protein
MAPLHGAFMQHQVPPDLLTMWVTVSETDARILVWQTGQNKKIF